MKNANPSKAIQKMKELCWENFINIQEKIQNYVINKPAN